MISTKTWMELIVPVIFAICASAPVIESSTVSFPSNSPQNSFWYPTSEYSSDFIKHSRKIRSASSKPKKKNVLQVSKRLFDKIKKNQGVLEKNIQKEAKKEKKPPTVVSNPPSVYKSELRQNSKKSKIPESAYGTIEKQQAIPHLEHLTEEIEFEVRPKVLPSYDCPAYNSGKDREGKAIIKADPNNQFCFYYCNWGLHYVDCCSWPLMWNDKIKSCDWHWNLEVENADV